MKVTFKFVGVGVAALFFTLVSKLAMDSLVFL